MRALDSTHALRRRAIPRGVLGRGSRGAPCAARRPHGAVEAAGLAALLALAALAALCALASPASAGGGIYVFVDAQGVSHYTNIPGGDDRYQPIEKSGVPGRSRFAPPLRSDYDALIRAVVRDHAVPPALVKAVIAAESDFDPGAISRKGAQGLMQLMPATAQELGVVDPLEPVQNVRGGVSYLADLIERYGDLSRALAAYNAGPTAVDRYGGIPPYRETRDYVTRVLTYYRHYHGDFSR